jgi:hypothetical protein
VAAGQPADPGEPAPEAQLAEPTSAPEPAAAPEPAVASEAPAPPARDSTDDGATTRHTPSDVLDELARTLRRGIEEQRGAPVHRMTAAITVDPQLRLTGLSGNADGQAPVPTADTFGRMAEVLGQLADLPGSEPISAVTLRVDGDGVSHEVTGTHA